MANPGLFCLFSFFTIANFTEKTIGFNRIQTRIVGIKDEKGDHLTTSTAPTRLKLVSFFLICLKGIINNNDIGQENEEKNITTSEKFHNNKKDFVVIETDPREKHVRISRLKMMMIELDIKLINVIYETFPL